MRIVSFLVAAWLGIAAAEVRAAPPEAIVTFHNAGLYWNPDGTAEDRAVQVRFRASGESAWHEALPMPYLPIEGTDLERAAYRGSIVGLNPGTRYEVELTLSEGEQETLTFTTWPESFPEGEVTRVSPSGRLNITESGSADAYRVFDGGGQTFEADGLFNILVRARFVILRNFVLRGAELHAISLREGASDVVIEDCDISAWGSPGFQPEFGQNAAAAVHSNARDLARVVVQRNRIHHPNHDANNWREENCRRADQCSNHPSGPQAVGLYNSTGNHVIRYNEVWSDADHYYNDILGGGDNGSFRGYPGPDSDVYGNYLANCWDDAMEIEGGVRNVRVYANYVDHCFQAIGNAPVSIGPLYVFRNVVGRSEIAPGDSPGNFLKMGFASSIEWQRGFQYIFHNTLTNRDGRGFAGYGGSSRVIRHVVSRNNVLFVRGSDAISTSDRNRNNDLDYDLFDGSIPGDSQGNGFRGEPTFARGTFDDMMRVADYVLASGSLGHDGAEPIPNFNDRFSGEGPDVGAFENRAIRFGVEGEARFFESECASMELCDGLDNDCDDAVDEGCGGDAGVMDAAVEDGGRPEDAGVSDARDAFPLPDADGGDEPGPMMDGGCTTSGGAPFGSLVMLVVLFARRRRA